MGNYMQRNFNSEQRENAQVQGQSELSKTANLVEIAKLELLVCYKHKLEHAIRKLEAFRACFDILSHKCPNYQNISPELLYEIPRSKSVKTSSEGGAPDQQCKMLVKELATLKHEYEKLSLNVSSGVSTLREEIKSAWNQFNEKDADFTDQLQTKDDVLNKAHEKIRTLEARLEQLQSLISEKDRLVYGYKIKINIMGFEAHQKDEMIIKCSKELELLKFQRSIEIPISKQPLAEPSPCGTKEKSIRKGDSSDFEALRAELVKCENELMHKGIDIAILEEEIRLLKSEKAGNTPNLGRSSKDKSMWDGGVGYISDMEAAPSSGQLNMKSKPAGKMQILGFCSSERGTKALKKEPYLARSESPKGDIGLKRKLDDAIGVEETSKLYKPRRRLLKFGKPVCS